MLLAASRSLRGRRLTSGGQGATGPINGSPQTPKDHGLRGHRGALPGHLPQAAAGSPRDLKSSAKWSQ